MLKARGFNSLLLPLIAISAFIESGINRLSLCLEEILFFVPLYNTGIHQIFMETSKEKKDRSIKMEN